MTITNVKKVRQEGSGRTHKYRVVYEVWSDDPNDGPKSIDHEFATKTTLPDWGDIYRDRQGTGTERTIDRESWVSDITSRWVKNFVDGTAGTPGQLYHVYETTVEYSPVGDYKLDLAYNQMADVQVRKLEGLPYKWQPVYQFSFARRYVDRIEGLYRGTFKYPSSGVIPLGSITTTPNWVQNQYRLITNSADVYYDPPARGTEADLVMRVKNYSPSYWSPNDGTTPGIVATQKFDYSGEPAEPVFVPPTVASYAWAPAVQFRRYIGRVNSTSILHWDPEAGVGSGTAPPTAGDYVFWPPYTLKLESLTSRAVRINGMYCFENDWEFHYREGIPTDDPDANPLGWTDALPDVSRMQRASEDGKPCFEPITLPGGGVAAYDGAVLDGAGTPIVYSDSSNECGESYWLLWLAERTADFNDFNQPGKVAFFRWDDTIIDNPTIFS